MSNSIEHREKRRLRGKQNRKETRAGQGGVYGRKPQYFIKGEVVKVDGKLTQNFIPITRKGVHLLRLYTMGTVFYTHKPMPTTEPTVTKKKRIIQANLPLSETEAETVWNQRRPVPED